MHNSSTIKTGHVFSEAKFFLNDFIGDNLWLLPKDDANTWVIGIEKLF